MPTDFAAAERPHRRSPENFLFRKLVTPNSTYRPLSRYRAFYHDAGNARSGPRCQFASSALLPALRTAQRCRLVENTSRDLFVFGLRLQCSHTLRLVFKSRSSAFFMGEILAPFLAPSETIS
jgi:hypothetical protein